MFVVSLALIVLFPGSGPAPAIELNRAGLVHTSYDDAFNRAGQEGKPIFVLFSTQPQPSELQELKAKGLLNDFVVVVANRNTEIGRGIFAMFNWQANEGVSVIERGRQWQFARYERKLSSDELARVATSCRGAVGYPTVDVLAPNVAAYPPPAQPQNVLPQQLVQPGMPSGSFQGYQPVQFQPMPMFGSFGGSCIGGH